MMHLKNGKVIEHVELGTCRIEEVGYTHVRLTTQDGDEYEVPLSEFDTSEEPKQQHPEQITADNIGDVPWQRLRDELIYQDGKWWRCASLLALITNDRNARMLDFLVNWQNTRGKGRKWFYCRTRDIVAHGFIPPTTQPAIFRALEEQGLIKREMRGSPPRRWIRINYARICLKADKALKEWQDRYGDADEG